MIRGDLCVCCQKNMQKKFPAVFLSDMIFGGLFLRRVLKLSWFEVCLRDAVHWC